MLALLAADAVLCAAILIETMAALSLLKAANVHLLEEADPVVAYYRETLAPMLTGIMHLVPASVAQWYIDAYLIAGVLFFLFFIKQARAAMAPYDGGGKFETGVEAAVDAILPVVVCALGAAVFSLTLLPLLTPAAALVVALLNAAGIGLWFAIGRSYYVNLFGVIALTGGVYLLSR